MSDSYKYKTDGRELPLVLDGQPGSLARRCERGERLGCNTRLRLESSRHQPKQHDAHSGVALQRAAPTANSQYDVDRLRTESPEPTVRSARRATVEAGTGRRVQYANARPTDALPAGYSILRERRW